MTPTVKLFEQDGLEIEVSRTPESATVVWRGVSDARSPTSFLSPILSELVRELRGMNVTIDLSALEYMSSATFSPLINLVRMLNTSSIPAVVLFSEADWQRTQLQCMRAIARATETLAPVSGSPTLALRLNGRDRDGVDDVLDQRAT